MDLPADRQLRVVGTLAAKMFALEAELQLLEQQAAAKRQEINRIADDDLPSAMMEAGIKDFSLQNGAKLTCEPYLNVSIKEEDRAAAYQWLRDNGHGDIIKDVVSVAFGKGEDEAARTLVNYVKEQFEQLPEEKESVHPSTLKAWAKDQVANQKVPPEKLFGLVTGTRAKIKPPKGA